MTIKGIAALSIAAALGLTACGGTRIIEPSAAPTTTVAPTTVAPATTIAPATTVAPPTTAAPGPTVYVPYPVYPTPPVPTYETPVAPSGGAVWGWYPLASYIQNSVYLHTTTNLTASYVDQVYVGSDLGVICAAYGQTVTEYENSNQWDYVESTDGSFGWVADQFIDVDGPSVPRC